MFKARLGLEGLEAPGFKNLGFSGFLREASRAWGR